MTRHIAMACTLLGLSALLGAPTTASAAPPDGTVWTLEMPGTKGVDRIQVIAVSHEVVSPRDAASGLPTGKRMHKPMVITKELDKSTPLLMSALVTGQTVPSATLTRWGVNPKTGIMQPVFTIRLSSASVASVATRVAPRDAASGLATGKRQHLSSDGGSDDYEEVSFTYQKIEWTWVDGGIMAMDDWEARN